MGLEIRKYWLEVARFYRVCLCVRIVSPASLLKTKKVKKSLAIVSNIYIFDLTASRSLPDKSITFWKKEKFIYELRMDALGKGT